MCWTKWLALASDCKFSLSSVFNLFVRIFSHWSCASATQNVLTTVTNEARNTFLWCKAPQSCFSAATDVSSVRSFLKSSLYLLYLVHYIFSFRMIVDVKVWLMSAQRWTAALPSLRVLQQLLFLKFSTAPVAAGSVWCKCSHAELDLAWHQFTLNCTWGISFDRLS